MSARHHFLPSALQPLTSEVPGCAVVVLLHNGVYDQVALRGAPHEVVVREATAGSSREHSGITPAILLYRTPRFDGQVAREQVTAGRRTDSGLVPRRHGGPLGARAVSYTHLTLPTIY